MSRQVRGFSTASTSFRSLDLLAGALAARFPLPDLHLAVGPCSPSLEHSHNTKTEIFLELVTSAQDS